MSYQLNINNTPAKPFNSFKSAPKVKKGYMNYRYHNSEAVETHTKVKALAGSVLGAGISAAIVAKTQKVKLSNPLNLFKLKYGVKELIAVSSLSIIGGVIGGMIGSNKKKEKMDEGVFHFMNATVPLLFVHPVTKFLENSKSLKDNKIARIVGIAASLLVGMKGAAVLSNFINDPNDKVPDRKLTMKDAVANIDDALGALAIAKVPFADKVEKIIPLIFVWCGYRAGQSN